MRWRIALLYLGQVHAWPQLERRRDIQRRSRTNHPRTVRDRASSNLHRDADHDCWNRYRVWPRCRDHRAAVSVLGSVDQTALRGKTHARKIPGSVCGLPAAREAHHSVHPLADRSWKIEDGGQRSQVSIRKSLSCFHIRAWRFEFFPSPISKLQTPNFLTNGNILRELAGT